MTRISKRLHAFLLAGALALSLTACGGSNTNGTSVSSTAVYAVKTWANLTIASGDQQVTLMWNDTNIPTTSTVTAPTVTYNVYFSTNPGVTKGGNGVSKVANGTSTTFIHTGLKNGTTYYYVVSAVTADGTEGAVSREASAAPQASIPAAPTGVTIDSGNGQVTLNLTTTGNFSYNVYWSLSSGVTKSNGNKIPGVTFPLVHKPLLANGSTTYYYVVTAQTPSGESAESRQLSATPLTSAASSTRFSSVQEVSAVYGDQSATVAWTPPLNTPTGSVGILTYNLRYWTSANSNMITLNGVMSPFIHQSLTNGTTYYYNVIPVSTVSGTAFANTSTATVSVIPGTTTPAIPTNLSAAAQSQQIQLSWQKDTSGATVTYNIYWSNDNSTWSKISNLTTNAFTHSGLNSGTTYYYQVSAQNDGESARSNTVSAIP